MPLLLGLKVCKHISHKLSQPFKPFIGLCALVTLKAPFSLGFALYSGIIDMIASNYGYGWKIDHWSIYQSMT